MATIEESTMQERQNLLNAGMVELSLSELKAAVARLGYRIDSHMCLDYVNRGNSIPYKARSISYRDIETGLGFAHCEGRRDSRFRELQAMRFSSFVYCRGRIYEL